jgi:hypothetical protein
LLTLVFLPALYMAVLGKEDAVPKPMPAEQPA